MKRPSGAGTRRRPSWRLRSPAAAPASRQAGTHRPSLVNPALACSLPRFTASVSASYLSASLMRYSILNTGVLSTPGPVTDRSLGVDFGGLAFRLGKWAFAASADLSENYGRPLLEYRAEERGVQVYSIRAEQAGWLRSFNLTAARTISRRLSAGLGIRVLRGELERTTAETFMRGRGPHRRRAAADALGDILERGPDLCILRARLRRPRLPGPLSSAGVEPKPPRIQGPGVRNGHLDLRGRKGPLRAALGRGGGGFLASGGEAPGRFRRPVRQMVILQSVLFRRAEGPRFPGHLDGGRGDRIFGLLSPVRPQCHLPVPDRDRPRSPAHEGPRVNIHLPHIRKRLGLGACPPRYLGRPGRRTRIGGRADGPPGRDDVEL